MKTCNKCNNEYELSEFPTQISHGKVRYRAYCKNCNRENSLEAYYKRKNNPNYKASRTKANWNKRLKDMGITETEFEDYGDVKNWECEICHTPVIDKPYTDHNHTTGKFRGILCFHCNVGIGHFHDSIKLLQAAITYLSEQNQPRP